MNEYDSARMHDVLRVESGYELVDDETTQELMGAYYDAWRADADASPGALLRRTQHFDSAVRALRTLENGA